MRPGFLIGAVIRILFRSKGIDLGQFGRRRAHVEFSGNDIGDQAGAVFAEQFDLTVGAVGCSVQPIRTCLYLSRD